MRTSPPIVRTILLVFMFLIALPPASIASAKTTTDEIVRETVRWTLTPDQCKDIRHRIDGTGERLQVITTTVKADGSREIIDNDIVTGTARDSRDRSYQFVYMNQTIQLVPPQGAPIRVTMTDSFDLRRNHGGSADNLNVAFVWRWTYRPPAELWPPVQNWEKIFTLGDPLTCDPI